MDKVGSPSPEWAIEIQGLTKAFGNHYALKGIDLKVRKGTCLTVFGPNGAGKTTLIRLLSTTSKPSGGTILLDGADVRTESTHIRRKLGVVSHATFLYNGLTVHENLRFYGKMYGVLNLEERVREVISHVQLEARLYDRVGTLSRGMQQRVAIARAILHNPSIMLLDEPETGLDPHATIMMREILDSLNSGNRTVLMTTHNLERGVELGDQIVILNQGEVVYDVLKPELTTASFPEVYDKYIGMRA